MGVLNVTPDSFSDGGQFLDVDAAQTQAQRMVQSGAVILDIGGESTRPGAEGVTADEELERVLPVLRFVRDLDCLVSIDTRKARVAQAALAEGAHIVNDVSGLEEDPAMVDLVAESGAGAVVMHMQGSPSTMQQNPEYDDVVGDVTDYLSCRMHALESAGIEHACICLDPGIGFGKTLEHNLELLAGLPRLQKLHGPILLGLSRKRFIGSIIERVVEHRLAGSLAAMAYGVMRGAHIVRVHDVEESLDTAKMIDALLEKEGNLGMD